LTLSQQSSAHWILKSVALVTLLAIAWIAVAPTAPGQLWALIAPVLLFVLEAATAGAPESQEYELPLSPIISVLSARAPPSLSLLVIRNWTRNSRFKRTRGV